MRRRLNGATTDERTATTVPAPRAFIPDAERIQTLRLEKALSQRELARTTGLRAGTVNRVEKGLPTRLSTIHLIAGVLGVQPLDIARVDD